MSPVPWSHALPPVSASVCALPGGTGLARVLARPPVALLALLRPRHGTPHAPIRMVCEAATPVASGPCITVF